jgi:hypothetical protein
MARRDIYFYIRIFLLLVIIAAIVGGGFLWFYDADAGKYTITFDDSHKLNQGSRVYFAGVDIGEVDDVKPTGAGVAVEIDVSKEHRQQLTTDSVFYIDTSGTQPSLLIKNLKAGAPTLTPGQTVAGTDSYLVWRSMDVAKSFNNFKETDLGKRVFSEVESLQQEVTQLVEDTDWDKVGEDARIIFNGISEDIDKALENPDVQLAMQMIDEKIKQAQEALAKVADSEEASQLNESLVRAYDKLVEEWGKTEKK